MVKRAFICIILMTLWLMSTHAADKPNIAVILADDMGIDSVAARNETCLIATPQLDAMFEVLLVGDAHSGSAVYTLTRYGLLAGRYSCEDWWQDDNPGRAGMTSDVVSRFPRTACASGPPGSSPSVDRVI